MVTGEGKGKTLMDTAENDGDEQAEDAEHSSRVCTSTAHSILSPCSQTAPTMPRVGPSERDLCRGGDE